MMKKSYEKYQASTLSRRELGIMDVVEQNTKLQPERHQKEKKKKLTEKNPWKQIGI